MFSPLTGSRTGSFDELFVRNPPGIGPFVSVTGVNALAPALSALEADLATSLASKRNILDSFSNTETAALLDEKADVATHFTRTQTHAIFQSVSDSVTALALKRNVPDSHSVSEIATLLAGKANEAATQKTGQGG